MVRFLRFPKLLCAALLGAAFGFGLPAAASADHWYPRPRFDVWLPPPPPFFFFPAPRPVYRYGPYYGYDRHERHERRERHYDRHERWDHDRDRHERW